MSGSTNLLENYYGLRSPTLQRQYELHELLDEPLAGKSFLDAGCDDGELCFQALDAGASHVVGIDADPVAIRDAREHSKDFAGRAEFFTWREINIEKLDDSFDVVVCMSEIERTIAPLGLLNNLARVVRGRLVVGCSPWKGRALQRRLGTRTPRWFLSCLKLLPVGLFVKGTHRRQGQVVLSPRALRNFLLCQMYRFSDVGVIDGTSLRRTLIVAKRRRIENLIVLAGPDAVGKSTQAAAIMANTATFVADRLGLDPALRWRLVYEQILPHFGKHNDENVILHYNLLNTLKSYTRIFHRDPALTFLENADNLYIVTLWADSTTLRERVQKRLSSFNSMKRNDPAERVLQFYEDDALLLELYKRWLEYCDDIKPRSHWILESNESQNLIRANDWNLR